MTFGTYLILRAAYIRGGGAYIWYFTVSYRALLVQPFVIPPPLKSTIYAGFGKFNLSGPYQRSSREPLIKSRLTPVPI